MPEQSSLENTAVSRWAIILQDRTISCRRTELPEFFSPLSVDDFIKKSSIIYYSREALEAVHKDIEIFCRGRTADCSC